MPLEMWYLENQKVLADLLTQFNCSTTGTHSDNVAHTKLISDQRRTNPLCCCSPEMCLTKLFKTFRYVPDVKNLTEPRKNRGGKSSLVTQR